MTLLSVRYYLPGLVAAALLLMACAKANNALPQAAPATLRAAAPFPMGAAVNPTLLRSNPAYRAVVSTEMSSLTPENVLKFAGVEPQQNTFQFQEGDYLADFAASTGQRMHGHTLVWHQSVPAWVTTFSGDQAAWEALFRNHIQTVVRHYRGRVASWDVANEVFNDDGTLRNTLWRQHLGNDYIARAFQYAHEADPGALLFYNDFGQQYAPAKTAAIVALVRDFQARHVPIDGLGVQMHIGLATSNQGISTALRTLAATGLKIHVSELDISVNSNTHPVSQLTDSLAQAQRAKYLFVAQQYRAQVPVAQRYGITIWNVGDADSWIPTYYHRPDWPLPFDQQYQKKPAYYGLLQGVQE